MGELSAETMTMKILEAIGDIKGSIAGLVSDVSYMRKRVDDLWSKVDEIERSKATRADLQEMEIRVEKTFAQVRAQTSIDLSRLEHDKIGHDQFSVDGFENFAVRLDGIERKIDALTGAERDLAEIKDRVDSLWRLKWQLVGGTAVLLAVGSLLGWVLHEASAFWQRH